MKEITIEWMHYDNEGETCARCNNTGNNIKAALARLAKNDRLKNVHINYKETKLDAGKMSDSNTILVNGQKLEDLIDASTSENFCHSCTCLGGKETNCRTIEKDGSSYEEVPIEMIIEGILNIVNYLN